MTEVFVSIGSNIDPWRHVPAAIEALRARFGELACSPVYETEPVGMEGDNFLNLVVGFETGLPAREVVDALHAIEAELGRTRTGPRFSPRTIDLDLLLYGDFVGEAGGAVLPRDEILRYAFVLRPLAELAPERVHPATGRALADLWADFDERDTPMRRVTLNC